MFLGSDIDLDELKPWFILYNFIEPSLGIVCACGPIIQGLVSSYRRSSPDVSYNASLTVQTMKLNADEQPLMPSNYDARAIRAGSPTSDRTMASPAPRDSVFDAHSSMYRWSGSTYLIPAFRHTVEGYPLDEEKCGVPFETNQVKTMAFFNGRTNIIRESARPGSIATWVDQVARQQHKRHSTRSWPLPSTCSLTLSEAVEAVAKPEEALFRFF